MFTVKLKPASIVHLLVFSVALFQGSDVDAPSTVAVTSNETLSLP